MKFLTLLALLLALPFSECSGGTYLDYSLAAPGPVEMTVDSFRIFFRRTVQDDPSTFFTEPSTGLNYYPHSEVAESISPSVSDAVSNGENFPYFDNVYGTFTDSIVIAGVQDHQALASWLWQWSIPGLYHNPDGTPAVVGGFYQAYLASVESLVGEDVILPGGVVQTKFTVTVNYRAFNVLPTLNDPVFNQLDPLYLFPGLFNGSETPIQSLDKVWFLFTNYLYPFPDGGNFRRPYYYGIDTPGHPVCTPADKVSIVSFALGSSAGGFFAFGFINPSKV